MSYVDYFCTCHDHGCKKQLVAHGEYTGLVLCGECGPDFKRALKNGFPGDYDEETHDRYMEKFGNKKERISRILDEVLKENGIDVDDED